MTAADSSKDICKILAWTETRGEAEKYAGARREEAVERYGESVRPEKNFFCDTEFNLKRHVLKAAGE